MDPRAAAQRVAQRARDAARRVTLARAVAQRQRDTDLTLQRLRDTHARVESLNRIADLARSRANHWRSLEAGDRYCDGYAHGYFDALSDAHAGKPEALAACGLA